MKNDRINTMKDSLQIRDERIAAQKQTIQKLTDALRNAQVTIHILNHKDNKKSFLACPDCKQVNDLLDEVGK